VDVEGEDADKGPMLISGYSVGTGMGRKVWATGRRFGI
jgi:hypothetical protein